jgi:ribose/xylose/arabinose/galactoside ABC-type transport system permease subunit
MGDRKFWQMWERFGLLFIIAIAIIALSFTSDNFATPSNFRNFINQAAVVAITGAGMTLAIACGGFDLSVGSVMALSACLGARTVIAGGVAESVAVSLATGLFIGMLNGLIITKLKVPAFIATLAMMTIVRGSALVYTQGREINIITAPAREAAYKFFGGGFVFSLPVPMLLMIAIVATFYLVLNHTRFGRHICATGSNEEAAVYSGLNTDRIKIAVFALVGLTAGISAVIQTSQLMGVNAGTCGMGFELQAIAVVVLGGTSLRGGKGKLCGTMAGAILVAIANNGLNLHNTPIFYQYLVFGFILLAAVSMDGLKSRFYIPSGTWAER